VIIVVDVKVNNIKMSDGIYFVEYHIDDDIIGRIKVPIDDPILVNEDWVETVIKNDIDRLKTNIAILDKVRKDYIGKVLKI
jgi:hypothetical protein